MGRRRGERRRAHRSLRDAEGRLRPRIRPKARADGLGGRGGARGGPELPRSSAPVHRLLLGDGARERADGCELEGGRVTNPRFIRLVLRSRSRPDALDLKFNASGGGEALFVPGGSLLRGDVSFCIGRKGPFGRSIAHTAILPHDIAGKAPVLLPSQRRPPLVGPEDGESRSAAGSVLRDGLDSPAAGGKRCWWVGASSSWAGCFVQAEEDCRTSTANEPGRAVIPSSTRLSTAGDSGRRDLIAALGTKQAAG